MDKLEDLENKYKELGEEIKKLKNENKGKWTPEIGEIYWCIDSYGDISYYPWSNGEADKYRRDFLKIFKTEEEAEEYLEFIKAKKEYSHEFTQEEWENNHIYKYYYYYNYEFKKIYTDWSLTCIYVNATYFKTEEDRYNFIKKYEKQIEKYDFGIE